MTIACSAAGVDFTRRLVAAEQVERQLNTPGDLRAAATRLVEATERIGCRNVLGASDRANLVLAGAAMLDPQVNMVDEKVLREGAVDKVVVVEAVAVTGMFIRDCVKAAREAGAIWVAVALLKDMTGPIDVDRFGQVDDLILFD
ncbi:hypothetical protein GCM10009821_20480 [Aeromicrobium halocynthiae]|uniref:Indole-3-glycerol-phosphate synthase n=1 Tax=Aeromicrobium halocynthiae TaxID=560557 RepID=A0ABN2W236_9ACTN